MKKAQWFSLWTSAIMGLALTVPANAEVEWSGSFSAGSVDTPEVEATVNDNNSPQGKAGGSVDVTAVSLTASIDLKKGVGLGLNPRMEITGGWLSGDETESEMSLTSAQGFVPVDGSGSADGDFIPGTVLNYETEIQDIDLDVMLRETMGSGKTFSWSAFGGLVLTRSQLDYTFDGSIPDIYTKDEIESLYYGLGAGVDSIYKVSPNLFLVAGASLDLLTRDTDLDVSQQIQGAMYEVSDSDSGFSTRFGGQLGAVLKINALNIGLTFSASHLSEAPTVEHALLNTDLFPTRLDTTSMTSYGISLGAGLNF